MVGKDVARGANKVDATIYQFADSESPAEISRRLGGVISPQAVAARTQTLLASKDWLTTQQEGQLIDLRLRKILVTLEDRFLDIDSAMMQLKLLKEMGNRLDKRAASTSLNLDSLYGNQGKLMAKAYDIALSYIKGALREQIDPDKWDELAKEALGHAQAELAKHEAIEQ